MPRKKITDKRKIENLKKELADCVQGRKDRTYFWATSEMYCPHCKKTYSYRQMWEALVKDLETIDAIMKKIDRSWNEVNNHLRRYKLRGGIVNPKKEINWDQKAGIMGYHSPTELFFNLRVNKRMTWRSISLACGNIGTEEVEKACKMFLDIPRKFKKKGGENNGEERETERKTD